MIRNDRQFSIAQARANRLETTESDVLRRIAAGEVSHQRGDLELRAVRGELGTLRSELAAYADLRDGRVGPGQLNAIEDLPELLIRTRISAGLTQAALADRLGMKEQQIQRYEANDYQSVALGRLIEIANALELDLSGERSLEDLDSDTIWRLIEASGFPKDLAVRRFADPTTHGASRAFGALSRLAHAFHTSPESILAGEANLVDQTAGALAYKRPDHLREDTTKVLAAYVKMLGSIVEPLIELDVQALPATPHDFRRRVTEHYGELTLRSVVSTLWDHGVPTLPLSEPGGFHAGLWQQGDRPIVALNSATPAVTRWLFDLLHEVGHLVDPTRSAAQQRFEEIDAVGSGIDTSEVRANTFATDVIFDGKSDELVSEVLELAQGRPELRQRAVRRVSINRNVDQGHLAFSVAFTLGTKGENWWGAAQNMQSLEIDPWRVVRDILLERTDFRSAGVTDREVLALAFTSPELGTISVPEEQL